MCRTLFARWRALPTWIAILTLALALPALAQTDVTTSRISGFGSRRRRIPRCPARPSKPGTLDTGLVSTAVTRNDGFYQIINLPTGCTG